jgi:hypothetical protein
MDTAYYPLNQMVRFPLIALDKNENVLNGAKALVKVIKHEFRTVLTKPAVISGRITTR